MTSVVEEAVERPARRPPGRRLLWLGLVVAIGLGVGASVLSWLAYSTEVARREDSLAATSNLAARSLDQFMSSRVALMESVAKLPGVQSGDPSRIRDELDAVSTESNGLSGGTGFIDANGMAQVQSTNAQQATLPLDLSDRDYVRQVLDTGKPVVSDVITGRLSGERLAPIAVPVIGPDGTLRGLLSASVVMDGLTRSIPLLETDEGTVRVIDRAGNVVLDDGRATVEPVVEPSAVDSGSESATTSTSNSSEATTTVHGPGVFGAPDRVTASAPVASAGWTVAVEERADDLAGDARTRLIQQLLVIAGVTAIGVAAVLWAMRRARAAHDKGARATRTLSALEDLAASTTQAEDQAAVASAALDVFDEHFHPMSLIIGVVDPDEETMAVMSRGGIDVDEFEEFRHLPLDNPSLVCDAHCQPGTQIVGIDEYERRFPAMARFVQSPVTGAIARRFIGPRASGAVSMAFEGEFPPSDFDIEVFEVMVSLLGEAFGRAASAQIERNVSETFQRVLRPRVHLPPDLPVHCAARYVPAQDVASVGGDWYDTFALDDGRVAIVVGDVVGQGVEAAAVMGQLRSAVRAFGTVSSTPAEALDRLDTFSDHIPGAFGSTVIAAFVDPTAGSVSIASAGHPPPLVSSGGVVRVLDEVRGTPLGFDLEHRSRTTTDLTLWIDDTVVLYTDGLVERRTEIIDTGIARLADAIAIDAHLPIQSFADALVRRCLPHDGGIDDVALVCLRPVADHSTTFSHTFPARLSEVGLARHKAERWLGGLGMQLDPKLVADVVLAISEAATNAIKHAYDDSFGHEVAVEMECRESLLEVSVLDTGVWAQPRPGSPGGRGLGIIRRVADKVLIDRRPDGTTLHLSFGVPQGGPSEDVTDPLVDSEPSASAEHLG